ncbi:hypothetical protein C8R45DRAFT_1063502 [Mycena sanguinolenta]|nr:hypothetical protein C8R45DRAFT_1063502 [Mycena sanguinolenta]
MFLAPRGKVNAQLEGLHSGRWCDNTRITMQNADDLHKHLEMARHYVVETFEGETRHFEFYYRDPWEWIVELATDPTLVNNIVWYPSRKYLVVDGVRRRLRDEPYTADYWWEIQSKLPQVDGLPHCLAWLLLWLDEGRVSSHTSMYPILLRPLFLPSQIRNCSGNGGSELVGHMIQVKDHRDPDSRTSEAKVRFAKFKRDIYHRVLRIIFVQSLAKRSHDGECLTCGDGVRRVLYPGIPVASLDGKEASIFTATRGPLANYPCSRCLVRGDQLHDIYTPGRTFQLRTTESMRTVYEEATAMRFKTHAEEHLQNHGLYSTENALWSIAHSSPYESASYDLLHSDDSGKFRKKLWTRLQEELARLGTKGILTSNMRKVPRWPGLKHFDTVTTKDINDAQSYLDIEKCLLPCIVQLLPKNSPFLHAIRAHINFQMLMGLHCFSEDQIKRKEKYQTEYGECVQKLSGTYPQYSFDFPKQHDVYHTSADMRAKGAPSNYCSRVNEGFHQENPEVDATKEAMARIRMAVNEADKQSQNHLESVASHVNIPVSEAAAAEGGDTQNDDTERHWQLGSPESLTDSRFAMRKAGWIDSTAAKDFDAHLRRFLHDAFPDVELGAESKILIRPYKCMYIHYTSLEGWTDQRDLLRCNPEFQANHDQRFDCVAVNMDHNPLTCARMLYLFRCYLAPAWEEDVVLVRLFKKSRWQPKTLWKNCRVLEDGRTMFILAKYLIRGVHLVNAFGCAKESTTYYLNDLVDNDWFLRAGN